MKVRFLGTRGEIEHRSRRHRRHSSVLVGYGGRALLVDWGLDWLGRSPGARPQALLLTHAHPDHAGGLRKGCPWPVYATETTWRGIARYPVAERRLLAPNRRQEIAGVAVEAFPVEHSLRAPAVGYRLEAGQAAIFYAPDVSLVEGAGKALSGIRLYVGDGAAITRSILRRRGGSTIGHASIRVQLDWCAEAGVERAIFTHCGSEIVRGGERAAAARVEQLARERGIRAAIAYDGLELRL